MQWVKQACRANICMALVRGGPFAAPLRQRSHADMCRSGLAQHRVNDAPHTRSLFNLSFLSGGERVPLTFVGHPLGTDKTITVQARVGQTLLEVAREHDIELEGACEGQLACSTW